MDEEYLNAAKEHFSEAIYQLEEAIMNLDAIEGFDISKIQLLLKNLESEEKLLRETRNKNNQTR